MGKRGVKRTLEILRFWRKTKKVGTCIIWTGYVNKKNGYGYFGKDIPGKPIGSITCSAHRYIYEACFGELPENIDVMHSCDNRVCVTLQHLSPGTRQANMTDAANKGRVAKGESHHQGKLNDKAIREIRRRCKSGESQTIVAHDYGVHQVVISNIMLGHIWVHVEDVPGVKYDPSTYVSGASRGKNKKRKGPRK